jgi:hypothetical protein
MWTQDTQRMHRQRQQLGLLDANTHGGLLHIAALFTQGWA